MDTNNQFSDCIPNSQRPPEPPSQSAEDALEEIWAELPWRKMEKQTYRLQRRIYLVTRKLQHQRNIKETNFSFRNDNLIKKLGKQLSSLQKMLISSKSALLLATRAITSRNRGRNTAGIDGEIILTDDQRMNIANTLDINTHEPLAVKRTYIPKSNGKQRPLGIPTIKDRIVQMVYKLALEPEWEAKFSASSYGFRPGRSPHDAVQAIQMDLNYKGKRGMEAWILNADLRAAFDNIRHDYILKQISPLFRPMVAKWLKANVWEKGTLFPSKEGTPQGGVISPLLANIALHFIDVLMDEVGWTENRHRYPSDKKGQFHNLRAIRYADDFVVIAPNREPLEKIQKILSTTLEKRIGVALNSDKTYISHTLPSLDKIRESEPCYFLGFRIQAHKARNKDKRFIQADPEPKRAHLFYRSLKEYAREHLNDPYDEFIRNLNLKIRGWGNYYRRFNSKKAFQRMDWQIYQIMKWVVWRKTGRRWQKRWKNFMVTDAKRRILFGTEQISVLMLTDASIEYSRANITTHTPFGVRRKPLPSLKPWYPRKGVAAFTAQRRTANNWRKYTQYVAIK